MENSKEKRITAELLRLDALFEGADANQKANVVPLIQNAAFMKVTLEDLQEIIIKEGVTETYQNGSNQYGVKQSATLQSYNALIKNYTSVVKTLSGLLPPDRKITAPVIQPQIETQTETVEERAERIKREIEAVAEWQRLSKEDPSIGPYHQWLATNGYKD